MYMYANRIAEKEAQRMEERWNGEKGGGGTGREQRGRERLCVMETGKYSHLFSLFAHVSPSIIIHILP